MKGQTYWLVSRGPVPRETLPVRISRIWLEISDAVRGFQPRRACRLRSPDLNNYLPNLVRNKQHCRRRGFQPRRACRLRSPDLNNYLPNLVGNKPPPYNNFNAAPPVARGPVPREPQLQRRSSRSARACPSRTSRVLGETRLTVDGCPRLTCP